MTGDVIVKDSPIHGKGVFAARDFMKGESVVVWDTSKTLTEQDIEKLSDEEKLYVVYFGGKRFLMQPPEKYINHSCNPNTFMKDFRDIAKRDIGKDEEITTDYSEEKNPIINFECHCGSRNCRKIIKGKI